MTTTIEDFFKTSTQFYPAGKTGLTKNEALYPSPKGLTSASSFADYTRPQAEPTLTHKTRADLLRRGGHKFLAGRKSLETAKQNANVNTLLAARQRATKGIV